MATNVYVYITLAVIFVANWNPHLIQTLWYEKIEFHLVATKNSDDLPCGAFVIFDNDGANCVLEI